MNLKYNMTNNSLFFVWSCSRRQESGVLFVTAFMIPDLQRHTVFVFDMYQNLV